jgi:positive regulator of sigma E activity
VALYALGMVFASLFMRTLITMIATMIIGIVSFRLVAHKARKDGLIDKKEEY